MTNGTKTPRRLVTVNAHDLQVNPVAQREFRPGWAGAVQGIYRQHGGRILSDTIATVQAGLGEHSYDRPNLMGISMVLARYGVEPAAMVRALLGVRGGTKGLLQSANRIRG